MSARIALIVVSVQHAEAKWKEQIQSTAEKYQIQTIVLRWDVPCGEKEFGTRIGIARSAQWKETYNEQNNQEQSNQFIHDVYERCTTATAWVNGQDHTFEIQAGGLV
jgi:hypothetical protein